MSSSAEGLIADLLDRWEEAAERGVELDPRELCAEAPELLPELIRQIQALREFDHRMGQVRNLDRGADKCTPSQERFHTDTSYSGLQLIAEGGLGEVYRAVDSELHRDVVLKFIRDRIADSIEHQETFRREAEITSRLDHPGVVPVYGTGVADDGRVFYAMRHIPGETLDAAIERLHADSQPSPTGLELRGLIGRFVTICKTVAYAHNRGIIHRDIKPANIMLGRFGETLLVDWGLATQVQRSEHFKCDNEQTLVPSLSDSSGSYDGAAGTPAFMSPEASTGGGLYPSTDIYSLGATLYKLLTGRAAVEARSFQELRDRIQRGDFPPPSKHNRSIPKSLDSICTKAMATRSDDRYVTALELAADLESFLADEPVRAYREPITNRAARWSRRHRSVVRALAVAVIGLATVVSVSAVRLGYMARREREARVTAEAAKTHGLRMSAKFAARTIASQIDLRWRILEAAAKDGDLLGYLQDVNSAPGDPTRWDPVQAWLNEQYIVLRDDQAVELNSLFVLDRYGRQVARTPRSDTIGRIFAYRDYFHGRGHDLPEKSDLSEVRPVSAANLSATYRGKTQGGLKVAFSVPVFDVARQRVAGVLGMSVDLGEFGVLDSDLHSDHIVVLVDSRQDSIDGTLQRGLILQHPALSADKPAPGSQRISPDYLDAVGTADSSGWLMDDFLDPLSAGKWLACGQPVMVSGRRSPTDDTGWIVLVLERRGG